VQPELVVVVAGAELEVLVVRTEVVDVAKVVEVCGTRVELVVELLGLAELVVPVLPPGTGSPIFRGQR